MMTENPTEKVRPSPEVVTPGAEAEVAKGPETPEQLGEYIDGQRELIVSESLATQKNADMFEAQSADPDADPDEIATAKKQLDELNAEAKQVEIETTAELDTLKIGHEGETAVPAKEKPVDAEEQEQTRIYEHRENDPAYQQFDEEITRQTNRDAEAARLGESGGMAKDEANRDYFTYWTRQNMRISRQQWDIFARRYPEKALAYSKHNNAIAQALERQQATATRNEKPKAQPSIPKPVGINIETADLPPDDKIVINNADLPPEDKINISRRDLGMEDNDEQDIQLAQPDIVLGESHDLSGDVVIHTPELDSAIGSHSAQVKEMQKEFVRPHVSQEQIDINVDEEVTVDPSKQQEEFRRRENIGKKIGDLERNAIPQIYKDVTYTSSHILEKQHTQEQNLSCTLASTINAMKALGYQGELSEGQLAEAINDNGADGMVSVDKTIDYMRNNGFEVDPVSSVADIITTLEDGGVIQITKGSINHRILVSGVTINKGVVEFTINDPQLEHSTKASLDQVIDWFNYDPEMVNYAESIKVKK